MLNPYGLLCGGLFILISVLPATVAKLIQIAETEIARKKELGDTLDYISQQFEHLAVVGSLQDLERCQHNFLINRALDVRSASFLYLAVTLRQISSRFGIPGMTISQLINNFRENYSSLSLRRREKPKNLFREMHRKLPQSTSCTPY